MQLSDAAVQEYIQLYREDFGEELTTSEARFNLRPRSVTRSTRPGY